ncbi:hypothetical protein BC835DRAFT_1423806 [Cytidiella melzeri]|nr:hypothetical protein BC835DRAFT_1423806 [Cytidiella melzeri]
MAAVQLDTSMKYIVDDPGVEVDAGQTRIVKIQNVASRLWACATVPPQGVPNLKAPIVVEPDNLQYDAYEEWRLELVDPALQHYLIQNVATGKYAWDPEPPKEGEDVILSSERRLWKISHVRDGRYTISPVGQKEKVLFWTDLEPAPSTPIKLEPLTGEKSHWRLLDVNDGSRIVKIQNVASELWACATDPRQDAPNLKAPIVVEPDNLQYDAYEEWRLKLVDPALQHYLIQNVATGKYAWDPEPPGKGEDVILSSETRLWKISQIRDGHYTISPVGQKEQVLFWTDVEPVPSTPITLEPLMGERSHWRLLDVHKGSRIVKIQNVASELWACATVPRQGVPNRRSPIVVEPDNLQYDAYEVWRLELVDPALQHYLIQNVATGKYAWDPEPPEKGEDVILSSDRRLWKILHVSDGHYIISAVGRMEKDLFWTDVMSKPGDPITLQHLEGEKSHWRFRDVNEGVLRDNLTSIVKIQHVPSKLWAAATPVRDGVSPQTAPVIVEPENMREPDYEIWKLTKVDREWWDRNGGRDVDRIHGGDVEKKVVGPYYLIQNLGTRRYAWDDEPPQEHIEVFQSNRSRVWKIMHVADGHYTISPAGEKEDELFWTARNLDKKGPITLEKPWGELHHWIIHAIKRDFVPQGQTTGGGHGVGHGVGHGTGHL